MNIKKISCAITLSLAAALPMTAFAAPVIPTTGDLTATLFAQPDLNIDLGEGVYGFVGMHSEKGATFFDEWQFTLADTSDVVISLVDFNYAASAGAPLLDNKLLTFSLFDSDDNVLGLAGEGGSISALNLSAGVWYTIAVSAKVNGTFGSLYQGALSINSTEVPIGGALPLFSSAILGLTISTRKRRNA